ncbi:coiled-coil domain-containing protein 97 [Cimex lectularius]|uniref:CCD97-like C-terminal domain-containing protein n=1 Tax=Cimex lectularius TaxID=79782 RepID=A0A8I6SDA6_CIMLE|nr:coiled-coil domain-containing protein 97 [Cimex lectularius]XP_024080628.1 coiled-coil domain-containing protein 97 [Cimex lectularius]
MESMAVDNGFDKNEDQESLKISLLNRISENNEAHFKSQQVGDPDLTTHEKFTIAKGILDKSKALFLSKYGKYLLDEHLKYFEGSDDYEINFYLNELQKGKKKLENKALIRNRRLEALRQLCTEGEYFSDMEMKRRNPLLFEELVGQYLTDKERSELEENTQPSDKSFSSIFFNIIEKNVMDSKLKQEIREDFNSMEPFLTLALPTKSSNWGEITEDAPSSSKKVLENSRQEDMSNNAKALLVNEFRSRVYSDFLGGKDEEFDYSTVDGNDEYDDLIMLETDQQDSYFDAESPKIVYSDDSNEDVMCD